jgi:hypothetical protein
VTRPSNLRLAGLLLRLGLPVGGGVIDVHGPLVVGVRGAHLTELALNGRLHNAGERPEAIGASHTDDPVLDAAWQKIHDHPGLTWAEWFWRQITDLTQSMNDEITALVTAGIWTQVRQRRFGVIPVTGYQDRADNPDDALAVAKDVRSGTSDVQATILGALAAICRLPGADRNPDEDENDITRLVPRYSPAIIAALDTTAGTIVTARGGGGAAYGPMSP